MNDLRSVSTTRYHAFPRTEPPPAWTEDLLDVFARHEEVISTVARPKGLTGDDVLAVVGPGLVSLGFEVEAGKRATDKVERPVFFGESGRPTLKYEIDAYHAEWRCGLEVEAGQAWMGNAVYRDLVQALVMVQVDALVLAVPNAYKYNTGGRVESSHDFDNTVGVAEALFGHSRMRLP